MQEVFEKIVKKLKDWTFNADVIMPNEERLNNRRLIASENAVEIVKQEAEQYNNGWIPCSERLPEPFENVLISTKQGGRAIGHRYSNRAYGRYYDLHESAVDEVIAWQPLPAPYRPTRESCRNRHENGNCLAVGGFCTSVDDKYCKHHKKKTNFDRCCESIEAMAQIIDIAKIGWTKDQIMDWLQKKECLVQD